MQSKKKWLLLPIIPLTALIVLAVVFERRTVIAKSSTRSPDGQWCLNLELTEFSNLVGSRKVLDTHVEHYANTKWSVKTSIPMKDADARVISNQDPDQPIVWSADSTTVSYSINDKIKEVIEIEADENYHRFRSELLATSITCPGGLAGG